MRSATRKRLGRDKNYIDWLHTQPCTIAGIGFPCDGHHQTGRDSAHRLGARFFSFHEIDLTEILNDLHERYAAERKAVA